MIFVRNEFPGLVLIRQEPRGDDRGSFARTFCAREFAAEGLPACFVQSNLSRTTRGATLRGMHFQREPWGEGKLIQCLRGAIHDVVIDLRPHSSCYRRYFSVVLHDGEPTALYVPPGFAHGFLTLADDTHVFYQMTECFNADAADGVRWNDPAFEIVWPMPNPIMSTRDASYPDYRD